MISNKLLSELGRLERVECKAHLDCKGVAVDSPIRSTELCDENPGCPYFDGGLGDCPVIRIELRDPTSGLTAIEKAITEEYIAKVDAL